MRNMWLVARREFVSRGKSGGYLASTLIMVIALLAMTLLPGLMEGSGAAPMRVKLLDKTGQVTAPLQAAVTAMAGQPGAREVTLEPVTGDEAALMDEVRSSGTVLLIVEGSYPSGLKARYFAHSPRDLGNAGVIMGPLEGIVRAARVQARGIDPAVTQEILQPMQTEVLQITASGEGRDEKGFVGSMLAALGIVTVLYMVILINGQFLFQGVLEEKVSRVMEVMAASVGPTEMLAGKVIGLGGLGLIQFLAMMVARIGGGMLSDRLTDTPAAGGITAQAAIISLAFLVLGYLLTSVLMAAAGATISRMEDSQTVLMPVTMLVAVPMMLIGVILQDPGGQLAVIMSFIPFCSQTVMVLRVLLTDVPAWEIAVSLGLMLVTTAFMIWAGGRIYRASMLSYGARPSFRQILGYLRG